MSADAVPEDAQIWEAAIKKLRSGLMPPPGKPQPEKAAVANMVSWLESTLDKAQATPYAGYVPLRRLNRREYANSVRDLLDLKIDAATWLPQDQLKDDFDTNAEQLQMTPAFMDQAVTAARSGCGLPGGGIRPLLSFLIAASQTLASSGTASADMVSKATLPAQSVVL